MDCLLDFPRFRLPKLTGIFGLESSQHFTVGQKLDKSPETEQKISPHIIFDFFSRMMLQSQHEVKCTSESLKRLSMIWGQVGEICAKMTFDF